MFSKISSFSIEERKKIGNRIRGARIMTGLTQELFSEKYSIALSTLKNFEIARVVPRDKTVGKIVEAIRAEGIKIDSLDTIQRFACQELYARLPRPGATAPSYLSPSLDAWKGRPCISQNQKYRYPENVGPAILAQG